MKQSHPGHQDNGGIERAAADMGGAYRLPASGQHAISGRQPHEAQQAKPLMVAASQGWQQWIQNSARMAAQRKVIDRFGRPASTSLAADAGARMANNAQMPIQRQIAIPPFNGPHPVTTLQGLPATQMNYTTQDSGGFTVPATNTAVLGAYRAGSDAINTNLSFALQVINQMRGDIYERCHLVAKALGGEGRADNIVPGTKAFNAAARDHIEMPIIEARQGAQKRLFAYTVNANYGAHANQNLKPVEKLLPVSFGYSLQEYHWSGAGSSTNIENWTAQPAINLGADAIKQNDLSSLGALDSDVAGVNEPRGGLDGITHYFAARVMGAINKTEVFMEVKNFIKSAVRASALRGINSGKGRVALPRDVTREVVDYMESQVPEVAQQVVHFMVSELNARANRVQTESLQLRNQAQQSITQKLTYSLTGEDQQVDSTGVDAAMKRIDARRSSLLADCTRLVEKHTTLTILPDPLDSLNDFASDVSDEISKTSLY